MRHLRAGKRLGVTTSHRRAMMRNLVTSLLEKGRIKTTLTRAKELRKDLDKMITLGKKGDLHARRQALRFIKSKEAMENLFEVLPDIYAKRQGGYSRIFKLNNRLGDNAKMALIELVDFNSKDQQENSQSSDSNDSGSTLEEVKAEVVQQTDAATGSEKVVEADAVKVTEVDSATEEIAENPEKDENKPNT